MDGACALRLAARAAPGATRVRTTSVQRLRIRDTFRRSPGPPPGVTRSRDVSRCLSWTGASVSRTPRGGRARRAQELRRLTPSAAPPPGSRPPARRRGATRRRARKPAAPRARDRRGDRARRRCRGPARRQAVAGRDCEGCPRRGRRPRRARHRRRAPARLRPDRGRTRRKRQSRPSRRPAFSSPSSELVLEFPLERGEPRRLSGEHRHAELERTSREDVAEFRVLVGMWLDLRAKNAVASSRQARICRTFARAVPGSAKSEKKSRSMPSSRYWNSSSSPPSHSLSAVLPLSVRPYTVRRRPLSMLASTSTSPRRFRRPSSG